MIFLSHGLKAVYAVAIAAVLVAALWPKSASQPQPVAVAPSPSPQPAPSSQSVDFFDPALGQAVHHVRSFDVATTAQWVSFCTETNSGVGYGAGAELICRALQYR